MGKFWRIAAWAILQAFLFGRVAAWAGTVLPAPGVPRGSTHSLKTTLKSLNQSQAPISVREGPAKGELFVEWRYDHATWLDFAGLNRMSRVHRLVLRLDETKGVVRAIEQSSRFDATANAGGIGLSWSLKQGISFVHYEHERVFGLQIRDGRLVRDPSYVYTFDVRELKQPVIAAIREAGWEFRPVLTFVRAIGG